MECPKIIVVDKKNNFLSVDTFTNALENESVRRIVRVLVYNSGNKILLQRRGTSTPIFPGMWDTSAAGHVDEGEDAKTAALRELHEEVGISNVSLNQIHEAYTKEISGELSLHCYAIIYSCMFEGEIKVDGEEVLEGKWFSPEELRNEIEKNPDDFTPGLKLTLEKHETLYSKEL